jgi:hypothetical protein
MAKRYTKHVMFKSSPEHKSADRNANAFRSLLFVAPGEDLKEASGEAGMCSCTVRTEASRSRRTVF